METIIVRKDITSIIGASQDVLENYEFDTIPEELLGVQQEVIGAYSYIEEAKAAFDEAVEKFRKYYDCTETEVNEYSYKAKSESIFLRGVHIYIETKNIMAKPTKSEVVEKYGEDFVGAIRNNRWEATGRTDECGKYEWSSFKVDPTTGDIIAAYYYTENDDQAMVDWATERFVLIR